MKNLAIITPCILPVPAVKGGAVEELITRIVDDNEKNGYLNIDLYTVGDYENNLCAYRYTNIVIINIPRIIQLTDRLSDKVYRRVPNANSRRLLDNLIVQRFVKRLEERNTLYDAVIVENMASTAIGIVDECSGKYDFPVFFHMHNDVDVYRSFHDINRLKRAGVQFIAVSEYIKSRILNGKKDARVSVLYNGTDLCDESKDKNDSSGIVRFLFAGRIIREKGVKELIEAFKRLGNVERFTLDIYGFSDTHSHYEKYILQMAKKNNRIRCHRKISNSEMKCLYGQFDVVVMPTINEEPFGLVALEAMANGAALITTASGALPEIVGNGAVIINKGGNLISELSTAMKKLADSEKFRKNLSEKALKHVQSMKDFDIKHYYENFIEIIREERITDSDVISVIVPVYNVSEYVTRCLNSIVEQSYRNLEIIVIDDGSTDGSGDICDEIADTDSRIKVIHQENMGLSAARNKGLDLALGNYVLFCDSDDFLERDTLEKMLIKLKNNHADIVACGINMVYDSDSVVAKKRELFTNASCGRWNGYESVIQMMRNNNICSVAWNKLYRKEVFKNIRFPLDVYNEDEATVYKFLYRAALVVFMPEALYNYSQRDSSIIHESLEDRYEFFLDAISDRITFFSDLGEEELKEHSRITLLEWIKYAYRKINDKKTKLLLVKKYKENVNVYNAPVIMGIRKKLALLLWKYYRY